MNKKNILLLIPALNAGGAERVMVTLANEWIKSNNISIIVFNDGYSFYKIDERINIMSLNLMPNKNKLLRNFSIPIIELKRFFNIYKIIKNNDFSFVLSFCYTTNVFASLVNMLLKEKKIIISERNDPVHYHKLLQTIINKIYKYSKVIICQNKNVQEYFINHSFKNDLLILPNPVNYNDIPIERPFNKKNEIVTVGRLVPQKNQELLIEAFNNIKNDFPMYSLKIYGVGPLQEKLSKKINDLNLSDRIFLMGAKKRVMFEVNKAAIFVLSSNFEGFPNVLIEAMATGMPVISSDFGTGIAKELINDGVNGYLFKVNSCSDLTKVLKKLLNRSGEFDQMGELNKKIASNYASDVVSNHWMMEILEHV